MGLFLFWGSFRPGILRIDQMGYVSYAGPLLCNSLFRVSRSRLFNGLEVR